MERLKTYLRPLRRRTGLTQAELSYLLGLKATGIVSRFEELLRKPSLSVALACQVIFGAPPAEIFPGLFSQVEKEVLRRAYDLYEELQGNPSATTRAKLDFLETVFDRSAKERTADTV
jgi:transcriptional regulator with XRE-family HTH domain